MTTNSGLYGIHPEIDRFISDLSFFGQHLASHGIIPANAGDISVVLSHDAAGAVGKCFGKPSYFVAFSGLSQLAQIRRDGRTHYNAESVPEAIVQNLIQPLAGRMLIITATGAKLWDVERDPGRRLNIIQVSRDCQGFFILYGNKEYGTIPSIETPSHLVGNAINLQRGMRNSSVLHCHPSMLVGLGAHVSIQGSYREFNKVLYSQKEGVLTNVSDLVAVVPYHPSGSRSLLENSIESIRNHRLTLWNHHGVLIREQSLERCVDLIEYAEDAACTAVQTLLYLGEFRRLKHEDLERAIRLYGVNPAILELLEQIRPQEHGSD